MSHRRGAYGFSLLEVLLALAITIVVMSLVAVTMSRARLVLESQSERSRAGSEVLRALEDISSELARAGQGLGEGVPAVLGRLPGALRDPSVVTIRSNPDARASWVQGVDLGDTTNLLLDDASQFAPGEPALLADVRGHHELVDIVAASTTAVSVRSSESANGEVGLAFGAASGTRVLGVREVRYFGRAIEGSPGLEIVKRVVGGSERVLARGVEGLSFELLDANGESLEASRAEDIGALRTVRIVLSYRPERALEAPRRLATAVTLSPRSGTVDFEERNPRLRLTRLFHPVPHPTALVSPLGESYGVIVGSGARPRRDPALMVTFQMERRFMGAGVDNAFVLDDVRAPIAAVMAPGNGPWAGSMFVAAWGMRLGHLSRIAEDPGGGFTAGSTVSTLTGTEVMAQAGGMAFGVDGRLYVMSREKGGVYRFPFNEPSRDPRPERVFDLKGTPGAVTQGADGQIYFLMEAGGHHGLWLMRFDETLSPVEPVQVSELSGQGVGIATDPVDGGLFVLMETRGRDFTVVGLSKGWLGRVLAEGPKSAEEPPAVFSLAQWREELDSGGVESAELDTGTLRPERLSFIAFDWTGALYLGASDDDAVFRFELPRSNGRYAVGLSAAVVERGFGLRPEIRMHAWKKSPLAY